MDNNWVNAIMTGLLFVVCACVWIYISREIDQDTGRRAISLWGRWEYLLYAIAGVLITLFHVFEHRLRPQTLIILAVTLAATMAFCRHLRRRYLRRAQNDSTAGS